MPVTALDGIVIAVTFFSALLAMVRGFSREVLSLVSWVLAAVFAYMLYGPALNLTSAYIHNEKIAIIVTIAVLFLIALVVLSIIAMRFADMIIDSRIGALDRTLGFAFGIARGLIILAIAALFLNGVVKPNEQPAWISQAKSKPLLDSLGNTLWQAVPQNLIDKIGDNASINHTEET